MFRIQPTGNATFDAVEVTAFTRYQTALSIYGQEPVPERTLRDLEVGYYFSLWDTARLYNSTVHPLDNTAGNLGLVRIPANTGVSLGVLTKNLATLLRDRKQPLPDGHYLAQSAVVLSGGSSNHAVVGDTLTSGDGATILGARRTNATWRVATVAAGPIPATVTLLTPGFYTLPLATGGTATAGGATNYTDCTLTVTYLFVPTTYNN